MLTSLLALCEWNPPVSGFFSQRTSNVEFLCPLSCWSEKTVEKIIKNSMISKHHFTAQWIPVPNFNSCTVGVWEWVNIYFPHFITVVVVIDKTIISLHLLCCYPLFHLGKINRLPGRGFRNQWIDILELCFHYLPRKNGWFIVYKEKQKGLIFYFMWEKYSISTSFWGKFNCCCTWKLIFSQNFRQLWTSSGEMPFCFKILLRTLLVTCLASSHYMN